MVSAESKIVLGSGILCSDIAGECTLDFKFDVVAGDSSDDLVSGETLDLDLDFERLDFKIDFVAGGCLDFEVDLVSGESIGSKDDLVAGKCLGLNEPEGSKTEDDETLGSKDELVAVEESICPKVDSLSVEESMCSKVDLVAGELLITKPEFDTLGPIVDVEGELKGSEVTFFPDEESVDFTVEGEESLFGLSAVEECINEGSLGSELKFIGSKFSACELIGSRVDPVEDEEYTGSKVDFVAGE